MDCSNMIQTKLKTWCNKVPNMTNLSELRNKSQSSFKRRLLDIKMKMIDNFVNYKKIISKKSKIKKKGKKI